MIERIFLDLDDVCNLFTPHVLRYLGCDVDETSYADYPVGVGFSMVKAANKLLGRERWTEASLWRKLGRQVWADVPPSPMLSWLLEQCESLVGRDNIAIATSPTREPECAAGKVDWIHAYLPDWLHRKFFIGSAKHLFATPRSLLIDDCAANLQAFSIAGGIAWPMPRPWNSHHKCDPQTYLAGKFAEERKRREPVRPAFPTFKYFQSIGLMPRLHS